MHHMMAFFCVTCLSSNTVKRKHDCKSKKAHHVVDRQTDLPTPDQRKCGNSKNCSEILFFVHTMIKQTFFFPFKVVSDELNNINHCIKVLAGV